MFSGYALAGCRGFLSARLPAASPRLASCHKPISRRSGSQPQAMAFCLSFASDINCGSNKCGATGTYQAPTATRQYFRAPDARLNISCVRRADAYSSAIAHADQIPNAATNWLGKNQLLSHRKTFKSHKYINTFAAKYALGSACNP